MLTDKLPTVALSNPIGATSTLTNDAYQLYMALAEEKFTEIFSLSQDPELAETGGGHGQKGVDFQRYWAILRIFELKQDGSTDFLLLFESIQDVAEFDSEKAPSRVDIYQIKKKDSGEWSFNELTGLLKPDGRTKKKVPPQFVQGRKEPSRQIV